MVELPALSSWVWFQIYAAHDPLGLARLVALVEGISLQEAYDLIEQIDLVEFQKLVANAQIDDSPVPGHSVLLVDETLTLEATPDMEDRGQWQAQAVEAFNVDAVLSSPVIVIPPALVQTVAASVIYGGAGDDVILGSVRPDTIYGRDGHDLLFGGTGNDTLYGEAGNDTLLGGAGDDWLYGGAGNDLLDGGEGTDTASYSAAVSGIVLNLFIGSASDDGDGGTDTLLSIENLTGSAFDDVLTGNAGDNMIHGLGGNDLIDGGDGDDVLDGGEGTDTLTYKQAGAAVTANLLAGVATGGAGTDTLAGFENLTGSAFDDVLTGNAGDNMIHGLGGNDLIDGGDGDDVLIAGVADITLLTAGFNTSTDGFAYADNVFGGTGGTYVNGTRVTNSGVNGNGSLEIFFDGMDATASGIMSGGWNLTFSAAEEIGNAMLSFDYIAARFGLHELDEDGFVYVRLDGAYYGVNGNDYLARFENDGNDPLFSTGWVHLDINLGPLAAGDHTLTVGGLVEGKNAADEDMIIRFDNISVAGTAGHDINASNLLDGGAGDDVLYGSAGADILRGGDGDDVIYSASTATITVADVLAAYAGVVYNAATDSFYQYVNSWLLWKDAQSAATSSLIFGTAGHLAQPNSAVENAYVDLISGANDIHLGGMDGMVNGEWRWFGGPDNGVQFWQGLAAGSSVGGEYTNWNGSEPNDWGGFEGRLMMKQSAGGRWTDDVENHWLTYVIEWEASQILTVGNETTLSGGDGQDALYGSDGTDVFVFESASAFNHIDEINNFSTAHHDRIDISDLLLGYAPGSSDDDLFASFMVLGADLLLGVDADGGAGGTNFVAVALLNGLGGSGLTIEGLVDDGYLVMA